jgi:hypothetical protein
MSEGDIAIVITATGSAEWPPDDRLRRVIQYPRDSSN